MTDQEMRDWIDQASYLELLGKWRFAAAGNPFFQGSLGKYYGEVMAKRRAEVGPGAAVAASKALG